MNLTSKLTHIYDAALSQNNWTSVLDHIGDAFHAKGVLLYASNNFGIDRVIQAANSHYNNLDEAVAEYMTKYNAYDAQAMQKVFGKSKYEFVRDSDVWSNLDFNEEPLREDIKFVIDTFGIKRRLGINISPNAAWNAGLVLQFDCSQQDFNEKHLVASSWINQHLSKAIEINRFYFRLQELYKAVLLTLNHVDIGICISDQSGRIVIKNTVAERILDQKDGINMSSAGYLNSSSEEVTRRIAECCKTVSETANGKNAIPEQTISIPRMSRRHPYLMEFSPLRDVNEELNKGFSGCFVVIIDADNPPDLDVSPFKKLFNLSEAESKVTELLISGYTAEQIAEMRNVTPNTVKNQTKQIYAKTFVQNRAQLVKKAASLSPPIKTKNTN